MPATDTDVLIVGAGPTGLMLANQLTRRGVRNIIIDRHQGPARETRALGVQARTLEIYSKLGIAERAVELGKPGTGANIWAQGRRMAHVPLGPMGADVTAFPYILILGQDDNERIMGDRLRQMGGEVRWNTELVHLEQDAHAATAILKQQGGTTAKVTANWVAGCDGARSTVRKVTGIAFEGAPYEHVFFVADTEATGGMIPDEINVYLWRSGFHLFFPMRGKDRWRIVGILPGELRDRNDVTIGDLAPSLRQELGEGLSIKSCNWFSTYRIHHRSASRFRQGRCFLLGDAAHIHSPVGAQGMNTGLQDAYNLAWKLALVIQGKARADLLDSYEEERLPIARRLLNTTDQAFRLVVSDNWFAGLLRTKLLARIAAFAMSRPAIRRLAFRVVSQTGINYRENSLSVSVGKFPDHAPRAGDRFPWLQLSFSTGAPAEDLYKKLDDTKFNLLLFGQDLPAGEFPEADLIDVHAIPGDGVNRAVLERAGIPVPSCYLLRPDGHVGLRGLGLAVSDIHDYLDRVLHQSR